MTLTQAGLRKDDVWVSIALAVALIGLVFGNGYLARQFYPDSRFRICVTSTRDLPAGTILADRDTVIRVRNIRDDEYFDEIGALKGRQLFRPIDRRAVIKPISLVHDFLLCPVEFKVNVDPKFTLSPKQRVVLVGDTAKHSRVFTVVKVPDTKDPFYTLKANHAEDTMTWVPGNKPYSVLVVP